MSSTSVVIVAYPGAELLDIASVTSALDVACRIGATPPYRVAVATTDGDSITCDSGLELRAQASLADVKEADTVIVTGGLGHEAAAENRELLGHVRRLARTARRVASVCTGATVLAEAGLLDGRRATTHWLYADALARRYPAIAVDSSPIFVRDGRVATSGGVTASLDLTLSFIEEDHGAELARRVALGMVTYLQRPGNQAQMSIFTASPRPDHAILRSVIDHVSTHPEKDLTATTLADLAAISSRQLNRLFNEHLGETPGNAVRRIRLEIAAALTSTTDLPFSQIARRCGFKSAETLRQAFVARYGVSPRAFRQMQSSVTASPPSHWEARRTG